jgi:hypothetical protein
MHMGLLDKALRSQNQQPQPETTDEDRPAEAWEMEDGKKKAH